MTSSTQQEPSEEIKQVREDLVFFKHTLDKLSRNIDQLVKQSSSIEQKVNQVVWELTKPDDLDEDYES